MNSTASSSCRKTLRALGTTGADEWLPTLLQFLPSAYSRTGHPAYLYVISTIVRSFGKEAKWQPSLAATVIPMVTFACQRLPSLPEFDAHPDDADDLFLLGYRGLAYAPETFLREDVLQLMLDTAVNGLLVQHREAFKCGPSCTACS